MASPRTPVCPKQRFLCHPSTTIDVEALKTYTSGLIFIAVGPKRAHVLEKKKKNNFWLGLRVLKVKTVLVLPKGRMPPNR
jgi:hypothetical protein